MQRVTIYSTMLCPFCWRAKRLLDLKGFDYEEIDIMETPGRRPEMVRLAGGQSTVPQIFIGDRHIGGFNELAALDKASELDSLVNAR
ncbi:MAG: Glutaredoxin-3 [Alphaproteobacteria bacterium MarineAlpha9_Bin5]|nr:MAG: Glutaredoxin-3 [Alphaproteobacteria bacterium MarineAlpha9_Bin5]HIB55881.1 glutaredoxin 3 [Alphaproteobacteria bacterium]HIO00526.1 glutaredoxin 3 [Alphaproteobacteria bacterium]